MADKKLIYEIIFDLKQKGIEGLNTVRKEAVQLEIQFEDVGEAASKILETLPAQAEKAAVVGKAVENIGTEIDEVAAKGKRMTDALSQPKGVANLNANRQAFNGLNMSINQVVRELPSATLGMNMFFLAISNNLPIFADSLKAASIEAKALRDAGQQSVPVWRQVLKGFLSWQTALVLGVTILSMYGKDIVKFVGNLFTFSNATDASRKSLEQLNKFSKTFNSQLVTELSNLRYVYQALTMTSEGTMSRKAAIEDLNKKYGEYMPYLLSEKSTLSEIDSVYRSINTNLRQKIALETKDAVVGDILKESQKVQEKALGNLEEALTKQGIGEALTESIITDLVKNAPKWRAAGDNIGEAVKNAYQNIGVDAPRVNVNATGVGKAINQFIKSFYEADTAVERVNKRVRLLLGITDEIKSIGEVVVTPDKSIANTQKQGKELNTNLLTVGGIKQKISELELAQSKAGITQSIALEKELILWREKLRLMENARTIGASNAPAPVMLEAKPIKAKNPKDYGLSFVDVPIAIDSKQAKKDLGDTIIGLNKATSELGGVSFDGLQYGLGGVSDLVSSISGQLNDNAGAWVRWGATIIQSLASALPVLLSFTSAKVAASSAEVTANTAVAATGAAAATAGIPVVGPFLAIGAIASILAALASIPKPKPFATGGIVFGNTLAQVGEYAGASTNPEVIAPLNKLKQYIKPENGGMSGEVVFRINGYVLEGILNKIKNKNDRVR